MSNLRQTCSRRGVTLIELLVALAITMIMMGAVITLFANMTNSVTDSRAVIEISERLRATRNRLQLDLAGHTATTMPPLRPESDEGYLEIIEGPNHDKSFSGGSPFTYSLLGDCDDILMLTVRSRNEPFVGHFGAAMAESATAEVVWFALPNGRQLPVSGTGPPIALYTLYRRVLLVLPQANLQGVGVNFGTVAGAQSAYTSYDVSGRYDQALATAIANPTFANTLGDLSKHENRFYHLLSQGQFPFQLNSSTTSLASTVLSGIRLGDDVILTDVLAFDIQVFDPTALMSSTQDASGIVTLLVPSDPGWNAPSAPAPTGAFVDLGFGINLSAANSYFSLAPCSSSKLSGIPSWLPPTTPVPPCTYDTWSLHYEQNGIDEDGLLGADQGTNGLDDDADGIVDDQPSIILPNPNANVTGSVSPGERETVPPYPVALRGVQVKIRVYEPDSQQVRQVTVVQDFLPE